MKLIPFTDFPHDERDALLGALRRLGMPLADVCVSRVEPPTGQESLGLPTMVLVSAPGWWRAYEGEDWLLRLEQDLSTLARGAPSSPAELRT
jgi:hypothetical protein